MSTTDEVARDQRPCLTQAALGCYAVNCLEEDVKKGLTALVWGRSQKFTVSRLGNEDKRSIACCCLVKTGRRDMVPMPA